VCGVCGANEEGAKRERADSTPDLPQPCQNVHHTWRVILTTLHRARRARVAHAAAARRSTNQEPTDRQLALELANKVSGGSCQ
jgi:hypothetical protein